MKVPGTERGKLLLKLADLIDEHGDELAALEALNNGKAVTIARNFDVKGAAGALRCVKFVRKDLGSNETVDFGLCPQTGIMAVGLIRFMGKQLR